MGIFDTDLKLIVRTAVVNKYFKLLNLPQLTF